MHSPGVRTDIAASCCLLDFLFLKESPKDDTQRKDRPALPKSLHPQSSYSKRQTNHSLTLSTPQITALPHYHHKQSAKSMPTLQSSWYINQLSQDRYGTDVPTLWNEVGRLNRKLKHRGEDLKRKDREISSLRRRYEQLKVNNKTWINAYDRVAEALSEERRRWRRAVY